MGHLVHRFTSSLRDRDGRVYIAEVWGTPREDGLWEGWLQFIRDDGAGVWRTDRETTQSSLEALTYWATGLEPVYLEGALQRAAPVLRPFAA